VATRFGRHIGSGRSGQYTGLPLELNLPARGVRSSRDLLRRRPRAVPRWFAEAGGRSASPSRSCCSAAPTRRSG